MTYRAAKVVVCLFAISLFRSPIQIVVYDVSLFESESIPAAASPCEGGRDDDSEV
jgi:hypothetical protein